jgi:O-antigen biosynthesis protein
MSVSAGILPAGPGAQSAAAIISRHGGNQRDIDEPAPEPGRRIAVRGMTAWLQALKLRLRLLNRQRLRRRQASRGAGYAEWLREFDTLGAAEAAALQARLQALVQRPVIAVLMPVYNPPADWLQQAIDSVRAQWYPHWELCIADDASTDPAVKQVLARAAAADPRIRITWRQDNGHIVQASNDALALVQAPFVALLDHDDLLREHTLLLVAEALNRWPLADVVYSDEDKLAIDGTRCDPYFKPDWSPELLLSQNYLCHLVTYRTARVREVGGFRAGFEGAQDHDLALRCTEGLNAQQVVHIPHVLYHWRQHDGSTARRGAAKPYAVQAGLRAVQEALARRALPAEVACDAFGWFDVRALCPAAAPAVSIIVPTRDGQQTLQRCVQSLFDSTHYPDWELIVVDNGSVDAGFLAWLATLAQRPRCRVLRDDRPFNYSALNNAAVAAASGEVVVLLNDDTEVLAPDWLAQMAAWAVQPGIGAVGARLWYDDMTLQHAGIVLGLGGVAGLVHRHLPRNEPGYRGRAALLQNFSAVTAACLAVRRDVYLQAGGLDEAALGVAFNDVDFCLKLQASGLRNLWLPLAELKHHESVSRGSDREARHRSRHAREVQVMQQRWGRTLLHDPAYNANLTLERADFSLAWPPRVRLLAPWFEGAA